MDLSNILKNLIKRALVTKDRTDEFGQCSFYENTDKYESIKPYGIASIPRQSDKPLVLLLNVNADESNKAGFEYTNKLPFNMETMSPGEVALYNPTNPLSYVIFKNDGETRLVGTKIAIGNSTTELLQKISDTLTQISADALASSIHTHSAGAVPPPDNAASFVAVKAAVDAIKVLIDTLKGTIS